jgi:hypothetical protein
VNQAIGFKYDDAEEYYRKISRGRKRLNPFEALVLLHRYMQKFRLDGWTARLDASLAMHEEIQARLGESVNLGNCDKREKRIGITSWAVEHRSPAQLKDTMLHEIAHALVDEVGHGPAWTGKALELGARPVPLWEPSPKSQEREWFKQEVKEIRRLIKHRI